MVLKINRNPHTWARALAVLSLLTMTPRFVMGGITFTVSGQPVSITAWSGGDYAIAAGMWLAYLVADKVTVPGQPVLPQGDA